MNHSNSTPIKSDWLTDLKRNRPAAFAQLYDRYAPRLLGVIRGILSDEQRADLVLESVFTEIHQRIEEYQPDRQPLFAWLLTLTRQVALDTRHGTKIVVLPTTLQLPQTDAVQPLTSLASSPAPQPAAPATGPKSNELINSILLKGCSPEEATGLPTAAARQQLRLALQQLRQPLPA